MPASVIRRVAAMFAPDLPTPSPADIAVALRASRSYLRQSADGEKASVYRLFHEGLAERLRQPDEAEAVYRGMLAGIGPSDRRNWGAAEPYVLAHALDHAVDTEELLDDPGFLVYADHRQYLPLLSESKRQLVQGLTPADTILSRRAVMARSAVESSRPGLARRIAGLPGEQPLPWLPLWADCALDGSAPVAAVVPATLDSSGVLRIWTQGPGSSEPVERLAISAFALAHQDGYPVIVTGNTHGAVQASGPDGGISTLGRHGKGVAAVAITGDQEELIVVSGGEEGTVYTHSLSTGQPVCGPVNFRDSLRDLAAGGHDQDPIGACVTAAGHLWTWPIEAGRNPTPYRWNLPPIRSVAVAALGERSVVIAVFEDGTARSLDCQAHTSLKALSEHDSAVQVVAAQIVAGRTMVVTGDQSGCIRKWDLRTGQPDGGRLKVCRGPVAALALRTTSNGLLCLAADKGLIGSASLWELEERRKLHDVGRGGASWVALSVDRSPAARHQGQRRPSAIEILAGADEPTAVIIGDHDGAVRAVEFDTGRPLNATVAAPGAPVTSIDALSLGGIPTVVVGTDHGAWLWQPLTGPVVVISADQRAHDVPNRPWQDRIVVNGRLVAVTRSPAGALMLGTEPLAGISDVTAIAVTHLDDRPVALIGDRRGLVRIYDLIDSRICDQLNAGGPVFAIAATVDGRLVVGAGGCVYGFRRFSGHQREA
jgi:WD40 repeat protein